jgi:polyphosphate kinase
MSSDLGVSPISMQGTATASTALVNARLAQGIAARCFGPRRDLPEWLMQPALALQAATDRRRPLAARLADLVAMVEGIDALFTDYLAPNWAWFHPPAMNVPPVHEALPRWVESLYGEAALLMRRHLVPEMADAGIALRPVVQTDESQRAWLHRHFMQRVYPLLTPLAVDPGRPFPFISSESFNLLVEMRRPEQGEETSEAPRLFARVKIPAEVPALITIPAPVSSRSVETLDHRPATVHVWTADLVRFFVHHVFTGMPLRRVYFFRIVRGETALPGAPRLAPARHRRQEDRPVVRLDVERRMEEPVLAWLLEHLRLPGYAVARHESLPEWHGLSSLLARMTTRTV